MSYTKNISMNPFPAWESAKLALDHTADLIGKNVDKVIKKIDLKFGDSEVGQKLQKTWSYLKHSTIDNEDHTHQKIRKAAYALFISLPALFFIKDIIKTTSQDHLRNIDSLGECISSLVKMAIYSSLILTGIDIALSFLPEEPPKAATKENTP